MKKVFPAIIVLVALSLLGVIVLQISWIENLQEVQAQKLLFKVDESAVRVTQEISRQVSGNSLSRIQARPDLVMPGVFSLNLIKPPTIAQHYSANEIYARLKNEFDKEGLEDLRFEFAITVNTDNANVVEMQSKNFMAASADTDHLQKRIIPIISDNENDITNLIPYEHLFIVIPDFKTQVWRSLIWMIIGSLLITLIVIAAFFLTVKTMLNQRKLSKIKSDFINNMTHEFKTPLATISLAVDALHNVRVENDTVKRQYFSNIIKEENKRMNKHVETILQAALMDKQEFKLNFQPLHIHEIIKQVVDNFSLQLQQKKGTVNLLLNAKNDLINADEIHFTNLISNLLDNSIKYSNDNLQITFTTHSSNKYLVMQLQDNGIGMTKETVKHIFEKFYRAHTGNLHNVKGFGLGMSYVKNIVDEHKGKIRVESTPGKGSTFTIEMLLAENMMPQSA